MGKNTPTFRFMNMHINTCAKNRKRLRITYGPLWRGPLVHWLRACIFTRDTKAKSGFSNSSTRCEFLKRNCSWSSGHIQSPDPWQLDFSEWHLRTRHFLPGRFRTLFLTGRRYRIIELQSQFSRASSLLIVSNPAATLRLLWDTFMFSKNLAYKNTGTSQVYKNVDLDPQRRY